VNGLVGLNVRTDWKPRPATTVIVHKYWPFWTAHFNWFIHSYTNTVKLSIINLWAERKGHKFFLFIYLHCFRLIYVNLVHGVLVISSNIAAVVVWNHKKKNNKCVNLHTCRNYPSLLDISSLNNIQLIHVKTQSSNVYWILLQYLSSKHNGGSNQGLIMFYCGWHISS